MEDAFPDRTFSSMSRDRRYRGQKYQEDAPREYIQK
jgi:hypothetical protein